MIRKLAFTLGVLVLSGCGSGETPFAPVSGKVTMNGKPLPNVYVSFQPIGTSDNPNPGRGSFAITDKDGHYALKSDGGRVGAVVGLHYVRISTYFKEDGAIVDPNRGSRDDLPPPKLTKEPIPTRYHSATTLKYQVQSGTNQKDWELTSP